MDSQMKYRPLTTAELRHIENNVHLTDREIGQGIGRSSQFVSKVRQRYGIVSKSKFTRMTESDRKFILSNPEVNSYQLSKLVKFAPSTIIYHRKKSQL